MESFGKCDKAWFRLRCPSVIDGMIPSGICRDQFAYWPAAFHEVRARFLRRQTMVSGSLRLGRNTVVVIVEKAFRFCSEWCCSMTSFIQDPIHSVFMSWSSAATRVEISTILPLRTRILQGSCQKGETSHFHSRGRHTDSQ
jgi:hypothetical protein